MTTGYHEWSIDEYRTGNYYEGCPTWWEYSITDQVGVVHLTDCEFSSPIDALGALLHAASIHGWIVDMSSFHGEAYHKKVNDG